MSIISQKSIIRIELSQLLFNIFLLLILLGCSKSSTKSNYNLELRVESKGSFKVCWNYTDNKDNDTDWVTHEAVLYNNFFSKKTTIKQGYSYALMVAPINKVECTAKVLINGEIIEEKTSNNYVLIDNTFLP